MASDVKECHSSLVTLMQYGNTLTIWFKSSRNEMESQQTVGKPNNSNYSCFDTIATVSLIMSSRVPAIPSFIVTLPSSHFRYSKVRYFINSFLISLQLFCPANFCPIVNQKEWPGVC